MGDVALLHNIPENVMNHIRFLFSKQKRRIPTIVTIWMRRPEVHLCTAQRQNV